MSREDFEAWFDAPENRGKTLSLFDSWQAAQAEMQEKFWDANRVSSAEFHILAEECANLDAFNEDYKRTILRLEDQKKALEEEIANQEAELKDWHRALAREKELEASLREQHQNQLDLLDKIDAYIRAERHTGNDDN